MNSLILISPYKGSGFQPILFVNGYFTGNYIARKRLLWSTFNVFNLCLMELHIAIFFLSFWRADIARPKRFFHIFHRG